MTPVSWDWHGWAITAGQCHVAVEERWEAVAIYNWRATSSKSMPMRIAIWLRGSLLLAPALQSAATADGRLLPTAIPQHT